MREPKNELALDEATLLKLFRVLPAEARGDVLLTVAKRIFLVGYEGKWIERSHYEEDELDSDLRNLIECAMPFGNDMAMILGDMFRTAITQAWDDTLPNVIFSSSADDAVNSPNLIDEYSSIAEQEYVSEWQPDESDVVSFIRDWRGRVAAQLVRKAKERSSSTSSDA